MDNVRLAGCVIEDENGKILLIHRNTSKRIQWELPGGKIDGDETPESAAKRELLEELGIKVRIKQKLGGQSFQEDGNILDYVWFSAEIIEGIPTLQEDKFDDLRYFTWEELKEGKITLSPNTKNLITAYFDKNF